MEVRDTTDDKSIVERDVNYCYANYAEMLTIPIVRTMIRKQRYYYYNYSNYVWCRLYTPVHHVWVIDVMPCIETVSNNTDPKSRINEHYDDQHATSSNYCVVSHEMCVD